jgi:hypothetical protein
MKFAFDRLSTAVHGPLHAARVVVQRETKLAYAANIKTDPTLNKFSLKTKVSAQDLREFSGVPHLFGAPEFPGI